MASRHDSPHDTAGFLLLQQSLCDRLFFLLLCCFLMGVLALGIGASRCVRRSALWIVVALATLRQAPMPRICEMLLRSLVLYYHHEGGSWGRRSLSYIPPPEVSKQSRTCPLN